MAYGDKLVIESQYNDKEYIHIEGRGGRPICDGGGFYVNGNACASCLEIYTTEKEKLARWNEGAGLEGGNKVQDDPNVFVERKPYTLGTAWNWNSAPGFDKNKNRKRR